MVELENSTSTAKDVQKINGHKLRRILAQHLLVWKDAKGELEEQAIGNQPGAVEATRKAPYTIFVLPIHLRSIHVESAWNITLRIEAVVIETWVRLPRPQRFQVVPEACPRRSIKISQTNTFEDGIRARGR